MYGHRFPVLVLLNVLILAICSNSNHTVVVVQAGRILVYQDEEEEQQQQQYQHQGQHNTVSKRRRQQQDAACNAYPTCSALGLVNDCCPASNGKFLDCCPSPTPLPVPLPTNNPIAQPTNPPASIEPTNNPIPPFFATDKPTTGAPIVVPPTTAPITILPPTEIPITQQTNIPSRKPTTSMPLSNAPLTILPSTIPPQTTTPVNSTTATATPTSLLPLLPTTTLPTTSPPFFVEDTSAPTMPNSTATSTVQAPTTEPSPPTTVPSPPTRTLSPATSSFQYRVTKLSVSEVQLTLRSESSATRRTLYYHRQLQTDDSKISSNCTMILQNLIIDRIENEVLRIVQAIETVDVFLQNFTSIYSNSTIEQYVFTVLINIRSSMVEYEPNRYIEGSLDTLSEQMIFIEDLQSNISSSKLNCNKYENINGVNIIIPKKLDTKSTSDDSQPTISVGIIAGIVGGCAVVMMIIGSIFIGARIRERRNENQIDNESNTNSLQGMRKGSPLEHDNDDRYNMSIMDGVHSNNDVSTLGDPAQSDHGYKSKSDQEDSTLASNNNEYDYRKAYGDTMSVTDSQLVGESSDGSSPRRSSRLQFGSLDDPSLTNGAGGSNSDIITAAEDTYGSPYYLSEEQFDVIAPVGLLGLVLETSIEDGRPMVFSIKPGSALAHIVKVGDRLLAVDGTDVSKIRASEVSRLIAEKKNMERSLVFSRLMKCNAVSNQRY